MQDLIIGRKYLILDKEGNHHGKIGRLVCIRDIENYSNEVALLLNGKEKKIINVKNAQNLKLLDGSFVCSRGDLFRAIAKGKISGQEVVDVIIHMRDLGLIEFNIPANNN